MEAKTVNIESLDLSFMCESHRLQYIANCKRINEAVISGYNTEIIGSLQWTNRLIIDCYNF